MSEDNKLEPYQVDHLILLVGGNPVPNAVAGRLLLRPGGFISLIHSELTNRVAEKLYLWFKNKGIDSERRLVDEANPSDIYHTIKNQLDRVNKKKIGLHYTGGTKLMSTHGYRAITHWAEKKGEKAICSYLNAHTLRLIIDPAGYDGEQPSSYYVGRAVQFNIADDLMFLQDWKFRSYKKEPFLPKTSLVLLSIYNSPERLQKWELWKQDELAVKCRRENDSRKWKSKEQLKSIELAWPFDDELTAALKEEFGLADSSHLVLAIASSNCGIKEPEKFCRWLDGGYWLESVVMQALQNIQNQSDQPSPIHTIGASLETDGIEFEIDIVAVRGYQLFALSCGAMTGTKAGEKSLLKHKVMEATIRAKQLGGDEAQSALVCLAPDTNSLAQQTKHLLNTSVKIFGACSLKSLDRLSSDLAVWIQQASKEG